MNVVKSGSYETIRSYLDEIPIIDTHEHYTGITGPSPDAISLMCFYFGADLQSAAFRERQSVSAAIWDTSLPFDVRYERFERYYHKARHTAYGKSMLRGLEACWGVKEITRSSIAELQEKLSGRNQAFYDELMRKHRIKAMIPDISFRQFWKMVEGEDHGYTEHCRFAFPLPEFHLVKNRSQLHLVQAAMGDGHITTLDDYMEGFERVLQRAVDFGAVCLKDQSAYWRTLHYGNPTKAEAEAVFNRLIYDPNDSASPAEAKALDDWLFQRFMRLARSHDIPVQLHTGHLAGNSGDVRKANAAHLIPLLELHSDVRFDLFHANWPYMGEGLFICKNYPNAYLNFCWAHIIDPIYCVEMMKRAIMTIPHSKIMAFGGDTDHIEMTIGYLLAAKDNVAAALSELVDSGWLGLSDAYQLAEDMFFNNANEIYGLNLDKETGGESVREEQP